MSCHEYRSGLIEMARRRAAGSAAGQVLRVHLEQCAECARFLETQESLTAALENLSTEEIPPASEFLAPVMAEFDRAHPARSKPGVIAIRWVAVAGLAAAACFAVMLTQHRTVSSPESLPAIALPKADVSHPALASSPAKKPSTAHHAAFRPAPHDVEQPFFPIPYTVPLAPGEWTRVERMQIPVAALIAAGFHVQVLDPAASVEADVLVSQDGRARAIRPVSISISN